MPGQKKEDLLKKTMDYLAGLIEIRLNQHFKKTEPMFPGDEHVAPEHNGLLKLVQKALQMPELCREEYVIFLLALIPHLKPHFFDDLLNKIIPDAGEFPQIGGVRGKNHRGFLPTGETALFILGGDDLTERFKLQKIFGQEHFFNRKKILWLDETANGDPTMSAKIILSQDCIDLIIHNKITQPRFGLNFPAQKLDTLMEWKDIILNPNTEKQIGELKLWLKHNDTLMIKHGMNKMLKPGYRVLFYGPPGTGKTLTATLLGKSCEPQRDVYKIDLSLMVSKYIGETEKNLSNLFDRAENKDWILFFDEADALFGKRTQIKDAHDRYANQEISYLLQRIENHNGLVILASNFKENIDDAFIRRFQAKIYFPLPSVEEKVKIFNLGKPDGFVLPDNDEAAAICQKYKLTGASIMNIMQFCLIKCLEVGTKEISSADIIDAIRRESLDGN